MQHFEHLCLWTPLHRPKAAQPVAYWTWNVNVSSHYRQKTNDFYFHTFWVSSLHRIFAVTSDSAYSMTACVHVTELTVMCLQCICFCLFSLAIYFFPEEFKKVLWCRGSCHCNHQCYLQWTTVLQQPGQSAEAWCELCKDGFCSWICECTTKAIYKNVCFLFLFFFHSFCCHYFGVPRRKKNIKSNTTL